jgi:hypothetical protein
MTQSQMFHFQADCGTLKPKFTLFPRHLKSYLDEFLCFFNAELKKNNQTLDYILPSNEDIFQFVKIDHDILRASLFLLVQNSIRHGERNSTILVHFELDEAGMADKKLTVAVENECACVDEQAWKDNLKPLFAFSRKTPSDNQIKSGAGIGLATVHAVTKALDCDFWVELNEKNKRVSAVFQVPIASGKIRLGLLGTGSTGGIFSSKNLNTKRLKMSEQSQNSFSDMVNQSVKNQGCNNASFLKYSAIPLQNNQKKSDMFLPRFSGLILEHESEQQSIVSPRSQIMRASKEPNQPQMIIEPER